jgi:hypothetical protein
MASLYSEADLSKLPLPRTGTEVVTETVLSAEGVALSLLRQFSEKHLPRASDLEWLVSEQDAPQQVQFCELLLRLSSSTDICNCYERKMGLSCAGTKVFGNYKYHVRSSHDMPGQAQRGGGGVTPTYSQPSTRKRWVVSTTPWLLYPWERPGACTGGWVVLGACLGSVENLTPTGIQFLDCPAPWQVAVPAMLS